MSGRTEKPSERTGTIREMIHDILNGQSSNAQHIENTEESLRKAWDVIKSSKEILFMFSTPNAFRRHAKADAFQSLRELVKKLGAGVRILVPADKEVEPMLGEAKLMYPRANIKVMDESLRARMSILIADRRHSIIFETDNDNEEDYEGAVGRATYSDSMSVANSLATIFESLWKQAEMYERLQAHDKAQKEFVDVAAHELRTPVQAILNYLEIAKGEPELSKEYLEKILRNAERLRRLTEDVLDVTRIESRTLHLEKERFDLADLLSNAIEERKGGLRERVLLQYEPAEKGRLMVEADRGRITQVVSNLINNAIQFTEDGTITLAAERKPGENPEIIVRIRDSGKGIDPAIMPVLFSKFAAKSRSGTGLGLYISKNIIQAHGGKIWGENNADGKGATFTFTLPALPEKKSKAVLEGRSRS